MERGELDEVAPNGQAIELECLMMALKQERERRGMSLTTVAENSGVTKSMLSELENGGRLNPTLETLYRYALAIGMHIRLMPVDTAKAWTDRG